MLNKVKILFFCFFLGTPIIINAQNDEVSISFKLLKVEFNDNFLFFTLKIFNEGEQGYTVYKPYLDDICSSIFKCHLIEKQTNKKHEVFPCSIINDIISIRLYEKNSVFLGKNEGFVKDFKIKLKDISPYITRGKYIIYAELNLKDAVYFETQLKNILKINLVTNRVEIDY